MCHECQRKRRIKTIQDYSDLTREYGFIDEYENGIGWWRNPETQAKIIARQEAWKGIGLHAPCLPFYTFKPSVAKSMGAKLALLIGLGITSVIKLQELSDDVDTRFLEIYNRLYNDPYSWIWNVAKSNFERVGKIKPYEDK